MTTTQMASRQIVDGAITDAKVASSAAIATSKLADGPKWIKNDGTVPMTGSLNLGSQTITNLGTPANPTDAASKTYVDTQIGNLNSIFDSKPSAIAATTGNITISNPGTAVFDTVTLTAGQILFVHLNTVQAENGLYTFNSSSTPLTRIPQMDAWNEVPGAFFAIEPGGAIYQNTIWLCTAIDGGTLGTTAITFIQIPTTAGLLNSNFVDKEVPSGTINGTNTVFTLANTPVSGSEVAVLNGLPQYPGASNDYTIAGSTLTFNTAPLTGERLWVNYRK